MALTQLRRSRAPLTFFAVFLFSALAVVARSMLDGRGHRRMRELRTVAAIFGASRWLGLPISACGRPGTSAT